MKDETKKVMKDFARKVVNYRCCNWSALQFEQMQSANGTMECNLCVDEEQKKFPNRENL